MAVGMRYLIGNWKMQLNEAESEHLAKDVVRLWGARASEKLEQRAAIVICPSHMAIEEVGKVTRGTSVGLGGQDVFWEDKGAYTGEVSPKTLKELGCEYCIVGHSERRQYLGETDAMVNKKVRALLSNRLTPVICVGETLEERRDGRRNAVVIGQVRAALEGIGQPVGNQQLVIAYEPRWAIGSGQPATPEDAAEMHHLILGTLHDLYAEDFVNRQCAVIYGGAVEPKNLAGFLAMPGISGALVGGASLKPQSFVELAEIANAA